MAKKGAHVVAVDANGEAPGLHSRHAAERAVVPSPGRRSGAFTGFLLGRKDLYGGLVIPTDDFHLRELHENRGSLEDKYTLCISSGEAVHIALHKDLAEEAAIQAGVPVPRSIPIRSENDISGILKTVRLPAIVKPVFSISFSSKFNTKVFEVSTEAQLREAFRRANDAGEAVILQEVIPGGDELVAVHVSYWNNDGNCTGDFTYQKTYQYPPIFGVGQLATVVKAKKPAELGGRLLRCIGYRGAVASIEFKYDRRDGEWKLIDVNTRTAMQVSLARPAGCDVLEMLWRDKLGLPPLPPTRIRYGMKWIYLKNAFLRFRGYPEKSPSIIEYLSHLAPPVVFGLFSADDPRPFLVDILPLVKRRLSFLRRDASLPHLS